MKKADRQKIFEKFGGKCAYCGCDLEKGWHVDHIEPIRRHRRWVNGNYFSRETGEVAKPSDVDEKTFLELYVWKECRYVENGCCHPENDVIENNNPSCPSCNINKHGDSIEVFRASIAGYLRSLNLRMVQYKMVKKYGLVQETGIEVVFYFEKFSSEQNVQECDTNPLNHGTKS